VQEGNHIVLTERTETASDVSRMSPNPFVFIVGCPRSGTTLLQRMVNAHREIAVMPETHWIARYFQKRIGLTPEGLVTPRLVGKVLKHRLFPDLQIEPDAVQQLARATQPMTYAEFVQGIFDLYGHRQGKRLVGEKTPGYVRSIATLHSLWPRARFVHILRDGRDVCLSILGWNRGDRAAGRFPTWAEDAVMTTAFFWEWNVRLGRERGTGLGGELYREVSYEALVPQPAEECAALCQFLDLPYDGNMLRFNEGHMRLEPGLDAKAAWLPPTAGLRDWRRQMPAPDVERFEAAAGNLLDELGYERAYPNPTADLLARAARIRDLFGERALVEGYSLPDRWLSD
jgi:hypothetical protein